MDDYNKPITTGSADYVLRSAQQELVTISMMADQKANILLGVSALMATAVVGVLPTTGLTIALVVLGCTTFFSASLALVTLLPTRPKLKGDANLLFFEHVSQLDQDDYRVQMHGVLASSEAIHEAILGDVHSASVALEQQKFRFLRWAYGTFIVGLALTAVGVVIDVARGTI